MTLSWFQSNITSIVLKQNVTMVDIQSTRMLGRVGFLAKVSFALTMWTIFGGIWFHSWYWFWISGRSHSDCDFCYLSETEELCECHTRVTDMLVFQVFTTFEKLGISVDVLATSEVSISLTLDPSKLWSRELIQQVQLSSADLVTEIVVCICFDGICIVAEASWTWPSKHGQ